ncbi:MAG: TonB-dependent receptor family protein [Methylophilaceae bacterium]|nr:TonB-dependent receptor [Methyloradius sp.]
MFTRKTLPLALLSIYSISQSAWAEETTAVSKEKITITAPVVVTATRIEQNSFDLPVSIDVVKKEDIQDGQLGMTLSESLIRVPGITAQNRTQMAQDPQISTRGFGARSAFGVRGLRLYVDGIPLSMPDGIGQPGNVDLDVVSSIEVLRGPFSSLYGNSSGGVIQLFTEKSPKTLELSGGTTFGSYGTHKENVKAAGTSEGIQYLVNYSDFESDGYRNHSANNKTQGTAKFGIEISEDTKLTALVNWFDQDAQDPLGLTRTLAFSNPKSAVGAAYLANTRVSRSNTQAGFNLEHKIDENNTLTFVNYVGTRENLQYLPVSASGSTGRASQISRDFWGTDLRWDHLGMFLEKNYTFSLGTTYGKMNDARTDINTINGVLNTTPAGLNRNEKNIAYNFDQYAQVKWSALDNLDLHAGVRHTKVQLKVEDNLFTNGDNSGKAEYQKTTPVVGAVWKVNPAINLYANYGKGFETPTFVEVAYSGPTGGVPNLGLSPSQSRNFEVGTKAFISDNTQINLSLFKTLTENEIVIQAGGAFTTYTNAGKTSRDGVELSLNSELPHNFSLYGAYTLLNAKFDSDFISNGNTVRSGNTIPGTYRTQAYGEVAWKNPPTGFRTAFEVRHNSMTYVNDINTDNAPDYTIFNIRAGFEQKIKSWKLSEYMRVENLFDKDYIGSIKVNDTNARFFEPAAGRNWLVGLNANYAF